MTARNPRVRRAAIERVDSPAVLVDCALNDALAGNRGAAVARLEDRVGLEQVARKIGKKDKAVYRTAREKLRLITERDAQPRRIAPVCADLCERAERLGHLQQWTQDRALLDHLDRQWAEIVAQVEPAWQTRYSAAREAFLAAYGSFRAANAAQLAAQEAQVALRARREELIAEAAEIAALDAETAIRETRERLAAAWTALEALPGGEQRDFERRFNHHLQSADTKAQALAEQRQQLDRMRKTHTRAEGLMRESKPLDLTQTRTLIEQGQALAAGLTRGGTASADAAALAAAFSDLATRLEARLKTQRRHAEQRLAELPARIDALQALVEAGELKQADPIHQSLQATLDLIHSSGLPKSVTGELEARLRTLSPRVRDLQHWRRWGADQHRQALCEAMDTLREQDLPLAAVAERLHVLKTDWQEVERAGSPANKALWERFHQAATAVGERVRPLLEAQAVEQEAHRAAREQVCQQLEDFLAQVDWERVDWKRVMRAEREVRQAWSLLGPCEPRARRRLDRRYHQAIRTLDQRLEDERARNQAHKQGLIERVRALAEQPELDAAIEETKAIQRQWHTTVPARQRDENRLWQSFRAACDAVFERRAVKHQAQRGELEANLATRTALCEEALAFAAAETDPRRLAAGLRDFEQRWRDGESLPLPRRGRGGPEPPLATGPGALTGAPPGARRRRAAGGHGLADPPGGPVRNPGAGSARSRDGHPERRGGPGRLVQPAGTAGPGPARGPQHATGRRPQGGSRSRLPGLPPRECPSQQRTAATAVPGTGDRRRGGIPRQPVPRAAQAPGQPARRAHERGRGRHPAQCRRPAARLVPERPGLPGPGPGGAGGASSTRTDGRDRGTGPDGGAGMNTRD